MLQDKVREFVSRHFSEELAQMIVMEAQSREQVERLADALENALIDEQFETFKDGMLDGQPSRLPVGVH